jgi:small subunit ribosomal protein S3
MKAGALGCELRISGKLPSERAKTWRFAEGYLKKAGESRKEVNRAYSVALTKTGIIGINVAIMAPTAKRYDVVELTEESFKTINSNAQVQPEKEDKKKTKKIKEVKEN